MATGKLIVIDGIDGSGKGTIINYFKEFAIAQGKKVFDLRDFWQTEHRFPKLEEVSSYDILLSAEPTFALVGQAIREEIIRNNTEHYSALSTAQAFALDREILYKKIILPALLHGISVFQERSFTTSIVYQPLQAEPLSVETILQLEGNQLALANSPDLLIITDLDPNTALARTDNRAKKDEAIFEKINLLEKMRVGFTSDWFKDIFKNTKTKIIYLDTGKDLAETKKDCQEIWQSLQQ